MGYRACNGITRQHEGWIEVTSSLGRGTTFDLYFPPVEYDSIALPPQANDQLGKNIHGKGKRVLIVEDDPGVRGLATAFAIRGGYDAIAAEDGPTALAVWRAKTSPFDLLFTDVVMPNGRSGIQLAEQLRQSDPRLKIIFTTGYSNALLSSHAGSIGDIPILLKPYSSSELLEAFQRALGLSTT